MLDALHLAALRTDLALRPLSPQAIRAAHALLDNGVEYNDQACAELVDAGLAEAEITIDDDTGWEEVEAWAPSDLLIDLDEGGQLDVLETRRGAFAA